MLVVLISSSSILSPSSPTHQKVNIVFVLSVTSYILTLTLVGSMEHPACKCLLPTKYEYYHKKDLDAVKKHELSGMLGKCCNNVLLICYVTSFTRLFQTDRVSIPSDS